MNKNQIRFFFFFIPISIGLIGTFKLLTYENDFIKRILNLSWLPGIFRSQSSSINQITLEQLKPDEKKAYTHKLPIHRWHFKTIDSTQSWALRNSQTLWQEYGIKGPNEWIEASATEQVAGIGSRPLNASAHRKWTSPPENFASSFIIPWPRSKLNLLKNVAQTASIAVHNVLDETGIKSQIKWINDILVNDRKISGILSHYVQTSTNFEKSDLDEIYDMVILGIGLNRKIIPDQHKINQPITSIEQELLDPKQLPDLEFLRERLSFHLYNLINNLIQNDFPPIREILTPNLCWIGREIQHDDGTKISKGKYIGIDNDGSLILEIESQRHYFQSGHISVIGK